LDARAVGDVLAVGHDEINGIIGPNAGEAVMDRVAAGFADDVADHEDIHGESLSGMELAQRLNKRDRKGNAAKQKKIGMQDKTLMQR
jgi:hypothetical protein